MYLFWVMSSVREYFETRFLVAKFRYWIFSKDTWVMVWFLAYDGLGNLGHSNIFKRCWIPGFSSFIPGHIDLSQLLLPYIIPDVISYVLLIETENNRVKSHGMKSSKHKPKSTFFFYLNFLKYFLRETISHFCP